MKIITKKEQQVIDRIILNKLKFMGRIQAEKYNNTERQIVNYQEIAKDAENILLADDCVAGF